VGSTPGPPPNQCLNIASTNQCANDLIYYITAHFYYKKGFRQCRGGETKGRRGHMNYETGHMHFEKFFQSFIAEAGMKTEAGVSLGPESARLGSRRGDSHF
jgi:hypothetical protein